MEGARAEQELIDAHPMRQQPPLPAKYHYRALELACALEGEGERLILNPRNVNTDDLELADRDWLVDMSRYRQGRRWAKQSIKVVGGGRNG
ncbi:MAG: hypothetical protein EBR82_55345 [Caulobacteraceae bacterium]|nr:hypothetical protein [Caulobacteraceae bacterium]